MLTPLKQQKLLHLIQSLTDEEAEFLKTYLKFKKSIRVSKITDLANELLTVIFSHLDTKALSNCSRVCKSWNKIMMDNYMWKQVCQKQNYKTVIGTKLYSVIPAWKHVYMNNYLTWKNWMVGRYKVKRLNKNPKGLCMEFNDQLAYSVTRGEPGKLWELKTGKCKTMLDHDGITAIKFNESYIVAGYRDGFIRLWDLQHNQWVLQFQAHQNAEIGTILVTKKVIVSGSEDHSIKIWDIRTGQCTAILQGHGGAICSLALHHGTIVSGSTDSTVKVWDLDTFSCIKTLSRHKGPVFCVQFNEKYICSGGNDAMVNIWDFKTGKFLRTLKGHHQAVVSLQFDDTKVVTGSADNTIKVLEIN